MQNQGAKGYQETLLLDTLDRMKRNPEGRFVRQAYPKIIGPTHLRA
jgi:hypothetical protein